MIEDGELLAGLRALAEREAATPEGRERVVAVLTETLASFDPPAPADRVGLARAVAKLAGDLVLLGDHAEWLAEKLMEPPPLQ